MQAERIVKIDLKLRDGEKEQLPQIATHKGAN